MSLLRLAAAAPLLALTLLPAHAASFDCSAATTPFEHAICDMPELSRADDIMAKSFATATGGLTKKATALMRSNQRDWLDYAQRACTDDAEPLVSGRYDEEGGACLASLFTARSGVLEQSRMIGGHRFLVQGLYGALPDPDEIDNQDSYWKVATHELNYIQLDNDDPLAASFNDYVLARANSMAEMALDAEVGDAYDTSSDSTLDVSVKQVAGTKRITLEATTYWYGYGAAHGNYSINYLHYYVPEARELVGSDIFAGDDWASTLVDAAWAQLQTQHKEWLQVETAGDIAEMVVLPTRWDLSDDYGLIIQFQQYEVAAYAYGTPTVTIPWDQLDAIKAETQDGVRFGY